MRWKALSCAALGVLASCDGAADHWVAWPPEAEGRSVVFAVEHAGLELRAVGVEAGPEPLRFSGLRREDLRRMEALVYDRPLEALGLREGPLVQTETPPARKLEKPDRVWTLDLEQSGASWVEEAAPSGEVSNASVQHLAGPELCTPFQHRGETLPERGTAEFALALSSTIALIGLRAGALMRIGRDEVEPVIAESSSPYPLSHGAIDPRTEELWFVDRAGRLLRGELREGRRLVLEFVETQVRELGRYRMFLRQSADGLEIYTISSWGVLARSLGGPFEVLHEFPDGDFGANVIETEEGDLLAAASGSTQIVRIRQGELAVEETGSPAGFTSAARVPGLGVVLGNSEGSFYLERNGGFEEIEGSPLRVFPLVLLPRGDGFLFGGAFGVIGEYRAGAYCPDLMQVAAASVTVATELSFGVLFATEDAGATNGPTLIRLE